MGMNCTLRCMNWLRHELRLTAHFWGAIQIMERSEKS
jgi:hypothetical protein